MTGGPRTDQMERKTTGFLEKSEFIAAAKQHLTKL